MKHRRNYKQKKINEETEGKTDNTHREQEDNKKQEQSFVCVGIILLCADM
jgi:hypothetical protein